MDSIPVLLGVSIISYLLISATAGNYVPGLELNRELKPEDVARLRHLMGVDIPWYLQYLNWLGIAWIMKSVGVAGVFGDSPISPGLLQGDLGRSLIDGTPISAQVIARLPYTMELAVTAILIGVLIAIPMGVVSGLRRGSRIDHSFTILSTSGIAIPHFWLGLCLILLLSVSFKAWGLPWLPSGGAESIAGGGDLLDRAVHLILPASVLSLGYLAVWSRYMRSSMLEVLGQDYVRTARAKGMPERRVTYVHALRNAIVPLVTLVGLEFPAIFSGALITEVVFSWPGLGRFALQAAQARDVTTLMALTVFGCFLVVVGNLIADILYAVLDPRIRYA